MPYLESFQISKINDKKLDFCCKMYYLYYVINDRDMETEEIVAMSVSEYADLCISIAEFNGHNDPHKVAWDYTFWHEAVSADRYDEVVAELASRGIESWDN